MVGLYKQTLSFRYQPATFPAIYFELLPGTYHEKQIHAHLQVPGLAEHRLPAFGRILGIAEEIVFGSWTVCCRCTGLVGE